MYSDQHKVPGLVWYNAKEKRIINYGSHIRELLKLGIKQSSRDVFYNLNQVHLSQQVKTLHEELDEKGIETCSINALLHRGAGTAICRFPFFFNDFRIKPVSQNQRIPAVFVRRFFQSESGQPLAFQKFGFNDRFSTNELVYLIQTNKVPPLALVYFPDLDQHVHKHGRNDAAGWRKPTGMFKGF